MGYPTVFPTGVLVYNKEKAYNGYTIYPSAKGALLIDMNGNEVNLWAGLGWIPEQRFFRVGSHGKLPWRTWWKIMHIRSAGSGAGGLWRKYRLEIRSHGTDRRSGKRTDLAGKTASRLPERRKYRWILLSGRRNENRQWKYHHPDP